MDEVKLQVLFYAWNFIILCDDIIFHHMKWWLGRKGLDCG
jgi:hypothetical protein